VTYIQTGRVAALGNERGSTIVFVSLAIAALLSIVALAVDIGMLYTARGEAQRAADASALAGAHSLIEWGGQASESAKEERVKDLAEETAGQNSVQGQEVVLDRDEDIEVDVANGRVTVTVRRIAGRGTAIATWFANVFGVAEADVAARATAEVAVANAGTCLKPFTLPDAFDDANLNGKYDPGETYIPAETGYGSDFRNGWRNKMDGSPAYWNDVDLPGTTYDYDFGRPMVLIPGKSQEAIVPSWFFPWDIPPREGGPSTGADRLADNIKNCNPAIILIGQEYMVENGVMEQKIEKAFDDLMASDQNARWDVDADSVVNSSYRPWTASPRKIDFPFFDPRWPVQPGKKPVEFNNIVSVWLDGKVSDIKNPNKNDLVGRFLFASGFAVGGGAGPPGPDVGNASQFVRLVE
jgi:Flp pilus assembly protein TadG